jgi:magnesium transporter
VTKEDVEEDVRNKGEEESGGGNGDARGSGRFSADYVSLGIREPEYEVRRTRRTG